MADPENSCAQPSKGPIIDPAADAAPSAQAPSPEEELLMIARVGKKAPDFEATGYFDGGFKNFKLSDHEGHWVLLCFYPGDFTYV